MAHQVKNQTVSLSVSPASSQVVLEDFATLRNNASGTALWAATVNGNQVGSLGAGLFDVNVTAAAVGGTDPGCGVYAHFFPYPYNAANSQGYAKAWKKSGTWQTGINRLSFWVKPPVNKARRADGGSTIEIGTYIRDPADNLPNDQGSHFYHITDPQLYANRQHLFVMNRHPQHQVGANSNTNWPDNPLAPLDYFDCLTRFYFEELGFSGAGHWKFSDFRFDLVANEPDYLVSSITACYTGARYELTWSGPKNVSQLYDVAYKTSSMKVSGFASGTAAGTVANPGSAYTGCLWQSPLMAENTGGMYIAIRPQGGSVFTEVFLPQKA